ncbi:MAG TPA: hypothetical protein VE733_04030 [Streptosporangiaceae bacterium]|nr:hypothetical protein [Streptosporangiaceae bacterium]
MSASDEGAAGQGAGPAGGIAVVPAARRRGGEPRRPAALGNAARWLWPAAFALAGIVLFLVYLRLSNTYPENSDQANLGLQAWDMLHGNLLLHGWVLSDVSFYTTELPQYMLLELILGLHTGTFHVAAAMTYTLVVLLAALLAKGKATGREAVVRTMVAGGIMLAPQLGFGVFVLLLTVGHIGTSVPLLLTWLVLDRWRSRWYVAAVIGILLAWGAVADSLVLAVGAVPLALVCGFRVIQGLFSAAGTDGGPSARLSRVLRSRWYELCLAGAAVAAAGASWAVTRLIRALGGYAVHPVTFQIEPVRQWVANIPATWHGVLLLFGADYVGAKPGSGLDFALLHLVGVALVGCALLLVVLRFFTRVSLTDQVLAVAIVINVVLYLISNMPSLNPHELAVVLPCGAALAGRMLAGRARASVHTGPVRRGVPSGPVRAALGGLGGLVLAGYLLGLAHEATRPPVPADKADLTSWLAAHHLTSGLGGYWEGSIVTVESGGSVKVRALMQFTLQADMWEAKGSWYDPRSQRANFVVFDSLPGFRRHWEPYSLVRKYFGVPARTYRFGPYTVMVWDKNLLASIPAGWQI